MGAFTMRRVKQGTHSKILIYDQRAVLTTSWNWLSHQYRPGVNARSEDGMYTTDPKAVQRVMASLGIR